MCFLGSIHIKKQLINEWCVAKLNKYFLHLSLLTIIVSKHIYNLIFSGENCGGHCFEFESCVKMSVEFSDGIILHNLVACRLDDHNDV